jgi:small subunit ribosomal protein S5e
MVATTERSSWPSALLLTLSRLYVTPLDVGRKYSNKALQIHIMTDQNPIQIAVDAIVNCGPREDSTRIGSAGTVRRQAVDVSPLRRVNQAIALLTIGAREAAFRNVKSVAECLAEELINAAKGSSNSYAIKKKDELERVAKSNR